MTDNTCYKILSHINSPKELRELSEEDVPALADELRSYIVEVVSKNGGHLASNLGVVELTLALHRVFNTPEDKIVWDVGHQAYAHKIITDRRDSFPTIRTPGGISGFTKRSESPYDPFGTGHSSTSISAAAGFAEASRIDGRDNYSIAVIGDGAMTGGLAYEALNNINRDSRLIIVLNDNEMSISASTGGLADYLSRIRSRPGYHSTKKATRDLLAKIPLIGDPVFKAVRYVKKGFKNIFFKSNYFEDMGLYYLGPVDGHDYKRLKALLEAAKEYGKACIIHVKTVKGKGYQPAESSPDVYHGVSPDGSLPATNNFSNAMGAFLCSRAEEDKQICAITAAMKDGCGLSEFAKRFPDRFFDVGIAEEHALVFAAALAAAGKKPTFAVYSSFLQRGYDNVIHDIALQGLPVTVCIDRAGLSTSDGATHNGIFDVAMLCQLPRAELYAPLTYESLGRYLDICLEGSLPSFIRYPNSPEIIREEDYIRKDCFLSDFEYAENADCFIVTYGRLVTEAKIAKTALAAFGISCGVIALEQLLPLESPCGYIEEALKGAKEDTPVLFAEEGIRNGGLGMCLADMLTQRERLGKLKLLVKAIDDPFAPCVKGQTSLSSAGLSGGDLAAALLHALGRDR